MNKHTNGITDRERDEVVARYWALDALHNQPRNEEVTR